MVLQRETQKGRSSHKRTVCDEWQSVVITSSERGRQISGQKIKAERQKDERLVQGEEEKIKCGKVARAREMHKRQYVITEGRRVRGGKIS